MLSNAIKSCDAYFIEIRQSYILFHQAISIRSHTTRSILLLFLEAEFTDRTFSSLSHTKTISILAMNDVFVLFVYVLPHQLPYLKKTECGVNVALLIVCQHRHPRPRRDATLTRYYHSRVASLAPRLFFIECVGRQAAKSSTAVASSTLYYMVSMDGVGGIVHARRWRHTLRNASTRRQHDDTPQVREPHESLR